MVSPVEQTSVTVPDTRQRSADMADMLRGSSRNDLLRAAEMYLEDAATALRAAAVKAGKVKGQTPNEYAAIIEYFAARVGGLRER